MAAKKKIRKQDKSISTFLNEWAEVIQNLPKYTYVNDKIAIVRAVKVLSEEMQNVAKKAGYKPDDILFITMIVLLLLAHLTEVRRRSSLRQA